MLENLFNFRYPFYAFPTEGWWPMSDIKTALFNLSCSGVIEVEGHNVFVLDVLSQITQAETYAKTGMILTAVAILGIIILLIRQHKTNKMLKKLLELKTKEETQKEE